MVVNIFWLVLATFIVLYFLLLLAWNWLRQQLLAKETAIIDLPLLGNPRAKQDKIKGAAVICGGSISGLITARVCHDHFERVLIVEPEAWLFTDDGMPTQAWTQKNKRTRVMQYRSGQGPIQRMGFLGLKRLFPSFEKECLASDIRILPADWKQNARGKSVPEPYKSFKGKLPETAYWCRAGVESLLRRLVLGQQKYPNIETMIGTVTAIHADPTDSSRIQKVSVRTADGIQNVEATMVADCTGSTAGMKWLERAGYGYTTFYPKGTYPLDQLKITFDHRMHYSTLRYRIPVSMNNTLHVPGGFGNSGVIYGCHTDYPSDGRALGLIRVDGNIVEIICGAWGSSDLPKDTETLEAYLKSFDATLEESIPVWVFDIVSRFKNESVTFTHEAVRTPPAVYHRYQHGVNLPRNMIAIGDSVMRVNPVYGHGILKAVLGAIALNTVLSTLKGREPQILPQDFAKHFFINQAGKIEPMWQITKTIDYGFTTTTPIPGESLSTGKLFRWYGVQLMHLAAVDEQVRYVLWHTKMFLAPGIESLHPNLVAKVLWRLLTG
ncbi:hypothetical protein BYT27DRAFT_6607012 [Phlegmacium glaucopus]|nr:hypothetical protein BYT27DRAFT_6607012 [Phlegmacium glaucopus]